MNKPSASVDNFKVGLILLAAGESKRMNGAPKQLLKFRGESLLRRAAKTALNSKCEPVMVVLGATHNLFINEINDLPLLTCVNNDWKIGMSSSLKCGLSELLKVEPSINAVVIMLCDQPFLKTETINSLVEIHLTTEKPIVASEYDKTVGVPALFAKEFFVELQNLDENSGAKKLIFSNKQITETLKLVEFLDVDTQRDYAKLLMIDELLTQ